MPTKIYLANIHIGNRVFNSYPVKKLPLNIMLADKGFINRLVNMVGQTGWNSLIEDRVKAENKKHFFPVIKIEYVKFLSNTIKEPELPWI